MALTVYGIKNCDAIKKAFQWLDAENFAYTFVDFKKDPPSPEQIDRWLKGVGDALINTRSPSYRQLPEDVKNQFSGVIRVDAIAAKPTLIKRPLLVRGDAMTVGFNPDHWATIPHLLST